MSSPDPDETHDIADTQMFRRFVEEEPRRDVEGGGVRNQRWLWIAIAVVVFIAVVVLLIVLTS